MAKEKENKIPLGLKILVGLFVLSLIFTLKDYQTFFDQGIILWFTVDQPWSIATNLTAVILGTIVPLMSIFNRKLLYWKLSFWYMVYSLFSMGMYIGKGVLTPSEVHVFILVILGLLSLLGVWMTWYYYSKKSYFNKK